MDKYVFPKRTQKDQRELNEMINQFSRMTIGPPIMGYRGIRASPYSFTPSPLAPRQNSVTVGPRDGVYSHSRERVRNISKVGYDNLDPKIKALIHPHVQQYDPNKLQNMPGDVKALIRGFAGVQTPAERKAAFKQAQIDYYTKGSQPPKQAKNLFERLR